MALPQLVLTRYSHLLTLMLQNYFTINLSGSFAEKKLKRGLVTLKDNPTIFQANTHKGRGFGTKRNTNKAPEGELLRSPSHF